MRKHLPVLWFILLFIVIYSIVGHMELQQEKLESAWAESVQALEAEQESIKLDIMEAKEQLDRVDEQLQAHNLLIWDIRNRIHLDLELEMEE